MNSAKSSWSQRFQSARSLRQEAGIDRRRGGPLGLQDSSSSCPPLIDFGSNDYLGLSTHAEVLSAFQNCKQYGATASSILSGYSAVHQQLESLLADLSQHPQAVLFWSGYAGHMGCIASFADKNDLILSDQLNHACLIDGCRLSRATVEVYPHVDFDFVSEFLTRERDKYERVLVVTESLFSMDGDLVDLQTLCAITSKFDCGLVVDEAHATGIYGDHGGGWVRESNVQSQILLKLGTLSKALGGAGGFASGEADTIDFLINHCRSYIFSTAPAVPCVVASSKAVEIAGSMDAERAHLRQTGHHLRAELRTQGWNIPAPIAANTPDDSPIIPIIVGTAREAVMLSGRLRELGIFVPAIRPPTVPEGSSRLRLSLSINQPQDAAEKLLDALRRC